MNEFAKAADFGIPKHNILQTDASLSLMHMQCSERLAFRNIPYCRQSNYYLLRMVLTSLPVFMQASSLGVITVIIVPRPEARSMSALSVLM